MPDIITALKADPGDANKVHIFIDGKYMMSVTLDVAAAEKHLEHAVELAPQQPIDLWSSGRRITEL